MNTSRPAIFILPVRPNSFAALTELMKSPPAFASPSTCAFDDCACSRNDEKSDAPSGCFTLPSTEPPLALMTSVVSFSSDWPNA